MTPEEKRHIQKIEDVWVYLFPEGGSTAGYSKGEVERNVDWMRAHPEFMAEYQKAAQACPNQLVIR